MQMNELMAGFASGLCMLPIAITISLILKKIVPVKSVAILLSFNSSIIILMFAPLPAMYAWKYHIVEILIMTDGLRYLLFSHWTTGIVVTIIGIRYIFKSSQRARKISRNRTEYSANNYLESSLKRMVE